MLKEKFKKNKVILFLFFLFCKCLTLISPKFNTKLTFRISKGFSINLKNPKTFDEKISWLKLYRYRNNELVSICADKFEVRKYIAKNGLSHILNDLYFTYKTPNDIKWEELPEKFAMKWNMGAGGNYICSDKNKISARELKRIMKKNKRKYYYLNYSELQYKKIKPMIIVEKNLANNNLGLDDYKIYCFNGVPKYVMVCVGRQYGIPKFYFFDRDWNFQRFNRDGQNASPNFMIPKPKDIDEMFSIAEILSKPFPFVRVDFYYIDGKIIFGELTFTPAGGQDSNVLPSMDKFFGDLLDLNNI